MRVLFVGLSNKIGKQPFDLTTNTGKIVRKIADKSGNDCYFCNLVSYAPVDMFNKLRYPTKKEINDAIPSFLEYVNMIKPNVVVSFGKIVSCYLSKIDNCKSILVPVLHPSYIYIYKKKELDNYMDDILSKINK